MTELSDREHFPQHECGIFGVHGHDNAAVLTYYGLFALQHRGQESAGIVTSDGEGASFRGPRPRKSPPPTPPVPNWPVEGQRPEAEVTS